MKNPMTLSPEQINLLVSMLQHLRCNPTRLLIQKGYVDDYFVRSCSLAAEKLPKFDANHRAYLVATLFHLGMLPSKQADGPSDGDIAEVLLSLSGVSPQAAHELTHPEETLDDVITIFRGGLDEEF